MIVHIDHGDPTEKIGSKGSSIMHLKKKGFSVPNGFILDYDFFVQTLDENKASEEISNLLNHLSSDKIRETSDSIIKLIERCVFSAENVKIIKQNIEDDKSYAIRSSGNMEDMDDFSFAGQYETFLNISGTKNIIIAILGCYKSLFSNNVLSYFSENKIDCRNLKMAVIVQEMIAVDKSGVAFTVNPLTGNDREIVIEIGEGLGENIVGGKVSPERYCYEWMSETRTDNNENILIDKNELKNIAKVCTSIQVEFGFPCDIEFAYENEKLFILQARPITKIIYSDDFGEWTNANFKDGGVSGTVCTPFMWSLYEYIWERSMGDFLVDSKLLKKKEITKLGQMFFGRPYWNIGAVKHAVSKVPGYNEKDFDEDLGITVDEDAASNCTSLSLKSVTNFLKIAMAHKKIMARRLKCLSEYQKMLSEKYKYYFRGLEREYTITELENLWGTLVRTDYLTCETIYFNQIFINTIQLILFKTKILRYVASEEYINLISGLENVSHLRPYYDLWELSKKIESDKSANCYWHETSIAQIDFDLNSNVKIQFLDDFRNYINKYGYHSDKELDVSYPCFYESAETVIKNLKNMIGLDDDEGQSRNHEKQFFNKQLQKLKEQVGATRYEKLLKSITKMRGLLWWREEYKDFSTRFYFIIRMYTKKLANEYCKLSVIENEDDIWFLTIDDISSFLRKEIDKEELKNRILKNKNYYLSFRNYKNDNELGRKKASKKRNNVLYDENLKGVGCRHGEITAVARIVETVDDIVNIKKGEILVAKYIDTGWTSKFSSIGGLITENGGILCHSSIIAREYGIPCIVSAKDITQKIVDGNVIYMNGLTGNIAKVKEH